MIFTCLEMLFFFWIFPAITKHKNHSWCMDLPETGDGPRITHGPCFAHTCGIYWHAITTSTCVVLANSCPPVLVNANFIAVFSRSPCAELGGFLSHLPVLTSAPAHKYYRILRFLSFFMQHLAPGHWFPTRIPGWGPSLSVVRCHSSPALNKDQFLVAALDSATQVEATGVHDDFEDGRKG